jgi:high-affinity iron transporter
LKTAFKISRHLPLVALILAVVGAGLLAARWPAGSASPPNAPASDAQRLVAILQYLESDYPAAVASGDEAELAEQRSLSAEAGATAVRVPAALAFVPRVASVDDRVRVGADPAGVSADCASLVDDLVMATGIRRAPAAPPDLAEGALIFSQTCASCHGPTGHGDGPAAAALKPKPADFHSDQVMGDLTPFKAFNIIRFGVKGTSMASFAMLDETRRWSLAFYLFTLRQPGCDRIPRSVSLDELATRSDTDLASAYGAAEVPCLRRSLPKLEPPVLLNAARAAMVDAEHRAASGDTSGAERLALDTYLTDIEPIEPWLRARDPEVTSQLEASFTATRSALQQRSPQAREDVVRLISLLDRAGGARPKATAISVFWFSFLVIVREGFEAAVIVAALLAVVKKRKQRARARFVHAGWLSALGVGAGVFLLGRRLLAGAMNERMEGFLAIVAAAMLLHAALWLNARSTTRRSMGELRSHTQGALDRGAFALFGIAFLAMFRETFETAVFLEALSIDAPTAVVWGALCGGVLLLALVVAVGRLGLRLPMTMLFKISTVVLVTTAIVLLGQGIHSFEEVGILPSRPMPFPRIEFLGIYPDRIGVIAQLVVVAAALAGKKLARRSPGRPDLRGAADPGE